MYSKDNQWVLTDGLDSRYPVFKTLGYKWYQGESLRGVWGYTNTVKGLVRAYFYILWIYLLNRVGIRHDTVSEVVETSTLFDFRGL